MSVARIRYDDNFLRGTHTHYNVTCDSLLALMHHIHPVAGTMIDESTELEALFIEENKAFYSD